MDRITTADDRIFMQAVLPPQMQVMQRNAIGQVNQGANGLQIMARTVPQYGQMQVNSYTQTIQQNQEFPVSNLQQVGPGQVLLQRPQRAQRTPSLNSVQPTIFQTPEVSIFYPNGSIQLAQSAMSPNKNCAMMLHKVATNNNVLQFQTAALLGADRLQEERLHLNPKQYHRILKRREARAKLVAQGRIPKERAKYLNESRHKHAMNRIRDEGGRFQSGSVKKKKAGKLEEGNESKNPLQDKTIFYNNL